MLHRPASSTQGTIQDEVGVYRQKLRELYRAIDDAYAQIRALQSPTLRRASARTDGERFSEHDGETIVADAEMTDTDRVALAADRPRTLWQRFRKRLINEQLVAAVIGRAPRSCDRGVAREVDGDRSRVSRRASVSCGMFVGEKNRPVRVSAPPRYVARLRASSETWRGPYRGQRVLRN
jgi:hypothetical protein